MSTKGGNCTEEDTSTTVQRKGFRDGKASAVLTTITICQADKVEEKK